MPDKCYRTMILRKVLLVGLLIMTALEKGRGKYRNIMIIGPANWAKTFLLKPLSVTLQHFL